MTCESDADFSTLATLAEEIDLKNLGLNASSCSEIS